MISTYRIPLLLLLTFLATNISAQTHQFGFVAMVGNVAKPVHKEREAGFNTDVDWTKPGFVTILGIVNRFTLRKRVFLTSELLIRFASTSRGYENVLNAYDYHVETTQTDRLAETSIVLPVKLEWAPFKKQRTFLSLGFGAAKAIDAAVSTRKTVVDNTFPQANLDYNYKGAWQSSNDLPVELSFNAGISYRFSRQTSLGIELTVEPYQREIYVYLPAYAMEDCQCSYYPYLEVPAMLSLTVSLRHLLLKEP